MYTAEIKKIQKIIIIYGTVGGNSELVAQAISDGISEFGLVSQIHKAEITNPDELNNYDACILVSSTWRVGQLNEYMQDFYNKFITQSFEGKYFGVVGLGDSKHYDIFGGAATILEDGVKRVKGKQLLETLQIDGEVFGRLLEFKDWGKNFAAELSKL